jgi:hypothetical protein
MVRLRMLTLLSLGLLLVASSASSQEIIVRSPEATFEWTEASGEVDFYDVYVERSGERIPHPETRTADTDPPKVTIAGTMGEVIRVSVVAGNDEGARGPQSPWSDPVRFGVPHDVFLPGVFRAHGSGSTPGDLFYDEPETGDVWVVKGDDPDAEPLHVGNEPDPDWEVVATGNFDGDSDGVADLLWRNAADGATRIWTMDADGALSEELDSGLDPGAEWTPLMAGDFDGNLQDDLFWRNHEGQTLAWMFKEFSWWTWLSKEVTRDGEYSKIDEQRFPSVPNEDWQLLATGDFDGNGQDELFWRDIEEGRTALWFCVFVSEGVLHYVQYERSDDLTSEWDVVEVVGNDEDDSEGLLIRREPPPNTSDFIWWWVDDE